MEAGCRCGGKSCDERSSVANIVSFTGRSEFYGINMFKLAGLVGLVSFLIVN